MKKLFVITELSIVILFISLFIMGGMRHEKRAVAAPHKLTHHEAVLSNILYLESTHGKYICGKGGEYGVAQFKLRTFNWMKKKANMDWLDWRSQFDQVVLLSWAVRNGYGHHWTTYSKAVQLAEAIR